MSDDPRITLGNALRAALAVLLPVRFDGLMLHACAAVLGGHGVAVAGLSTAGKTTLALGVRDAVYLSDDVTLVVDVGVTPYLTPSPFYGSAGRPGEDVSAPLRAIGVLVDKVTERGAHSTYELVSRTRGVAELLRHVACFTKDRELSARLLDRTVSLAERVPVVLVRRSLLDSSDAVLRAVLREAGCPTG